MIKGFQKYFKTNYGFTLIELLVVVSIIGLLASVVLSSLSGAREKSRLAAYKDAVKQITKAVELKRDEKDLTLGKITLSPNNCSACACYSAWGGNPNSQACIDRMTSTMQAIGFPDLIRDPWGGVMLIDENEGEQGPSDCRVDTVFSEIYVNKYAVNGVPAKKQAIPLWFCAAPDSYQSDVEY